MGDYFEITFMNKQPANKESFQKLLEFGKQILDICDKLEIMPIVYGSLAYFFYTEDETLPVNDIDFLVPESFFSDLMKELDKLEGVKYKKMPYHSIESFKGEMEIDLDSIEYFLDPRSREEAIMEINEMKFHIINKDSLIDIYQEALDNMPQEKNLDEKRSRYQKKLDNLEQ